MNTDLLSLDLFHHIGARIHYKWSTALYWRSWKRIYVKCDSALTYHKADPYFELSFYGSYDGKNNKMQQCIKILLFLILNQAQHVSGETPPIIRSIKLHKQPLVMRTWKVV